MRLRGKRVNGPDLVGWVFEDWGQSSLAGKSMYVTTFMAGELGIIGYLNT